MPASLVLEVPACRSVFRFFFTGGLLFLLSGVSACSSKTKPSDFVYLPDPLFASEWDNDITYTNPILPPRLQRVIQYEGNVPLNIAEYDPQGKLIFHHYKYYMGSNWPGTYLTVITAHLYEGERLMRTYELHSNVGFTITDYAYGWWGWRVRAYVRRDSYDPKQEINTNPYQYITQIQSLSQLRAQPQVQLLERIGKKHLSKDWLYGLDKHIKQVVYWQENGSRDGKALRTYNAQQQLTRQVIVDEDGTPSQTLTLTYDRDQRLTQWLVLGERQDTSSLHLYQYTPEGRVRNDFGFTSHYTYTKSDGVVDEFLKRTYHYSPRGLITKETVSALLINKICGLACEGQLREETVYRHNPEGYVQEAVTQDYSAMERRRKVYRYTYQYWPL